MDSTVGSLNSILEKVNITEVDVSTHSNASTPTDKQSMKHNNQVPLLLIPTTDKSSDWRSLFCITENKTLSVKLNVPFNKRCSGSSHGWLAFAEDDLSITLFNPVNGATITLPPVMKTSDKVKDQEPKYRINKVILSADPSLSPESFEVAVKYFNWNNRLAFMKAGEKKWTRFPEIQIDKPFATSDMIFHDGKIYAVSLEGEVLSLDINSSATPQVVAKGFTSEAAHVYIAELSSGDLVIILKYIQCERSSHDGLPRTSKFEVYKLGFESKIEKVNNLDGDALFLGDNGSISFAAANSPGCKKNCIYFSDDYFDIRFSYEYKGPYDMGVFNMVDESIEMHYTPHSVHEDMPPPIWFIPSSTGSFELH